MRATYSLPSFSKWLHSFLVLLFIGLRGDFELKMHNSQSHRHTHIHLFIPLTWKYFPFSAFFFLFFAALLRSLQWHIQCYVAWCSIKNAIIIIIVIIIIITARIAAANNKCFLSLRVLQLDKNIKIQKIKNKNIKNILNTYVDTYAIYIVRIVCTYEWTFLLH